MTTPNIFLFLKIEHICPYRGESIDPPFRMKLEAEIAKWKALSQALPSKTDKEAFEDLMNHCRRHAGAAGAAVRPIASEAMIMSILLADEKMILEMEKSIRELRNAKTFSS